MEVSVAGGKGKEDVDKLMEDEEGDKGKKQRWETIRELIHFSMQKWVE